MPTTTGLAAQDCYLRLIELSSIEDFDGERCAADLRAHRELWDSAVVTDWYEGGYTLRDLPKGHPHGAIVLLLTDTRRAADLRALAAGWDAKDVETVSGPRAEQMIGRWGGTGLRPVVIRVYTARDRRGNT